MAQQGTRNVNKTLPYKHEVILEKHNQAWSKPKLNKHVINNQAYIQTQKQRKIKETWRAKVRTFTLTLELLRSWFWLFSLVNLFTTK